MSNQINHHEMANAIRALSIDAIETANSGHPIASWDGRCRNCII